MTKKNWQIAFRGKNYETSIDLTDTTLMTNMKSSQIIVSNPQVKQPFTFNQIYSMIPSH